MKLRTEVAIDIDQNRKLWLTTHADGVEVDDVADVVEGMAGSLLEQAIKAYQIVGPPLKEGETRIPPTFQEP